MDLIKHEGVGTLDKTANYDWVNKENTELKKDENHSML